MNNAKRYAFAAVVMPLICGIDNINMLLHPSAALCLLLHRPFITHLRFSEPDWPAVFSVQPSLAVGQASCNTASALRRVGAVEERNMLVTNILEPEKD